MLKYVLRNICAGMIPHHTTQHSHGTLPVYVLQKLTSFGHLISKYSHKATSLLLRYDDSKVTDIQKKVGKSYISETMKMCYCFLVLVQNVAS